jgi:uncharacterized protein YbdZ (MbtH family)
MSENITPIETTPEWHEAFPEPNTIPAGWDLSAVENSQAVVVEATSAEVEG